MGKLSLNNPIKDDLDIARIYRNLRTALITERFGA